SPDIQVSCWQGGGRVSLLFLEHLPNAASLPNTHAVLQSTFSLSLSLSLSLTYAHTLTHTHTFKHTHIQHIQKHTHRGQTHSCRQTEDTLYTHTVSLSLSHTPL